MTTIMTSKRFTKSPVVQLSLLLPIVYHECRAGKPPAVPRPHLLLLQMLWRTKTI
jgi:hypothetical protein